MDLAEIKELIALVQESGVVELEVAEGERRIRIVAAHAAVAAHAPQVQPSPSAEAGQKTQPQAAGDTIPAPLSGTFYRAPAPGEPPFVEVGGKVAAGDVLCIIESMKMMNKVRSERAGEIAEVLLDDGQAIESGTAMFRIL